MKGWKEKAWKLFTTNLLLPLILFFYRTEFAFWLEIILLSDMQCNVALHYWIQRSLRVETSGKERPNLNCCYVKNWDQPMIDGQEKWGSSQSCHSITMMTLATCHHSSLCPRFGYCSMEEWNIEDVSTTTIQQVHVCSLTFITSKQIVNQFVKYYYYYYLVIIIFVFFIINI